MGIVLLLVSEASLRRSVLIFIQPLTKLILNYTLPQHSPIFPEWVIIMQDGCLFQPLCVLFNFYIWSLALSTALFGDHRSLFWESPRLMQRWAELLSLAAADSDRSLSEQQCRAASSGIAALSPALFTLVTVQHLELTPGMSYRRCRSHRKWPVRLSLQTNTLFTLQFISVISVCRSAPCPEVNMFKANHLLARPVSLCTCLWGVRLHFYN